MASAPATSRFARGLLSMPLPSGFALARIHWSDKGPVFFGPAPGQPPGNRFDAPNGEYRTLYAAQGASGAFVETVLRRPGRILRRTDVEARSLTQLTTVRPFLLAKLFDEGLHWHGLHAGAISIDDYAYSRALALDLHAEFPALDGLAYRSRYNNGEICFALFDRVTTADLTPTSRLDFVDAPAAVDDLMRRYGATFDTSAAP